MIALQRVKLIIIMRDIMYLSVTDRPNEQKNKLMLYRLFEQSYFRNLIFWAYLSKTNKE